MRIVVEVREFGDDFVTWKTHLLERTRRLIDAKLSLSMEFSASCDPRHTHFVNLVEIGWESVRQREICRTYLQIGNLSADPSIPPFLEAGRRNVSCNRARLVEDRDWYSAPHVDVLRRAADADDFILSQEILPSMGMKQCLHFHRGWGDRPFSECDRKIVRLIHGELGRLWRKNLLEAASNPILHLSPRLQQALDLLRRGNSEKQVAAKMEVSRHTVHNFIKELHRRLKVSSRGELLAISSQHDSRRHNFPIGKVCPASGGPPPLGSVDIHCGSVMNAASQQKPS